jgi:hypothetical protein
MLKKNYRKAVAAGVAAVLVGAILFSPLLCGMTCLEARGMQSRAAVEAAAPAEELVGEFAESAVVRCVLTHVVSKIDFSELTDQVEVGNWVWVGVEVGKSVKVVETELVDWVGEV